MMEINDFIGIFDNVLDQRECQAFIDYFDHMKKLDLVWDRQELKDGAAHRKDDETAFVLQYDSLPVLRANPIMSLFLKKFWNCYEKYAEEYSILFDVEQHGIIGARLQKTKPGGGFHQWHCEAAATSVANRIGAFQIYLNDVEHGGETEFLYQKCRVSPQRGRLVIWPAAFTHTHRGNPPLSGTKYILTGWLEFVGKHET
jgi:hypothetical protein